MQENQQVFKEKQEQEQNEIQQVQQLSQTLLSQALDEHNQRSAEQYNQDQQRQCQNDAHPDSPSPSPSPSSSSGPPPSIPFQRSQSPPVVPAPAPPPPPPVRTPSPRPPSPPPNPDPDLSDSSSSDSDDLQDDNNPQPPLRVPPGGRPYAEPVQSHSLGPMNIQCPNCHALHFISEKLTNSGVREPRFGMCCLQGQVNIPAIQQWPCVLQDLFDDP